MDLFANSPKDTFRKNVYQKSSESDILENLSPKWQFQQWHEVAQHPVVDNKAALEREMEQTLGQVNDFLHQLEVTSKIYSKINSVKHREYKRHQATESHFKDRVKLGHTVMGKMKELLGLEDSGLQLMTSNRTFSNNSFKSTNSSSSIKDSVENISQGSCHTSEIRNVLRKFNRVLNYPGEANTSLKLKDLKLEEEARETIKPISEQECLQFLTDRLAKDNIQLIFQTLPPKESQSNHTVTCKVFNIVVEGHASEKSAAKKSAAIKMLERLVSDGLKKCLPPQISDFTNDEINEAVSVLCQTELYDLQLEDFCLEHRKPQPCYYVENEQNLTRVICAALGFQSNRSHKVPMIARRAAAWEILQLIKMKSRY